MAAATGPLYLKDFPTPASIPFVVATSQQIWSSAHVCTNSSGLLVPAADTSGLIYAGMTVTSSAPNATAGAATAAVVTPAIVPLKQWNTLTAPTQAWVGARVFAADDNNAALTGSVSNHICVGLCVAIGPNPNLQNPGSQGATNTIMVDSTARYVGATS